MSESITFAGNAPYPRLRNAWPRLAKAAEQLLAEREAKLPDMVAQSKLTQDAAERALRIMRAIAEQWRRVVAGTALPDPMDYPAKLGASQIEMREELERIASRAAKVATAGDADRRSAELAELTAALAWQQTPCAEGCAFPHIWQAHDLARYERTSRRHEAA